MFWCVKFFLEISGVFKHPKHPFSYGLDPSVHCMGKRHCYGIWWMVGWLTVSYCRPIACVTGTLKILLAVAHEALIRLWQRRTCCI